MQLENSHSGFAGKSLINYVQESLDKAIVDHEEAKEAVSTEGWDEIEAEVFDVMVAKADQLQGYVAGIAKALGILRGTSVKSEVGESRERISERNKTSTELIGTITGV